MPKRRITARRTAAFALSLFAAALAMPAAAVAAPEEGSGALVASPSPIVLPPTTAGTQSAMQTVSFEYQGSGEVLVQKLSIEGPEAGEFALGGSNCSGLSAGQRCEASIALKPGAAGTKQATLKVVFVGAHPEESFEISGDGVPAQISLNPASFDFGLQRINRDTASTIFELTNDGEGEVQLGNFEISGDSSVFWTGGSNCWGTWIAPGQSCAVEIDFGPREMRTYAAELHATANGATATAALSGEGGRAIVEPPELPIDFGAATVGSRGEVRTVTLRNTGNLPESFFIGIVAGGDSGSFRLLEENCSLHELVPLATCTAEVRFEPLGPGPKEAHLAFFGDGEGGVLVRLAGEAVAPAALLSPQSFDFGSLPVGSKSAAREFVVSNSADAALQLDRVAIVGSDIGAFALVGDTCTGVSLAPGGQCVVRVRFWPDEARAFEAALRISGPAGVLAAALSGRGLAADGSAPATAARLADVANSSAVMKKRHSHRRFAHNATISISAAPVWPGYESRRGHGERRSVDAKR